tara:strand:+ start:101 stop:1051 length:951 start_codon:yes stop_codon:yes gene_type:complete
MTETLRNLRVSEMPPQHAADPKTPAQQRARFFNSGNAFNVQLPPVPDMAFAEEPARALDPATPTGMILCDISDQLECPFPATSPLVLAGYARIRAGESLNTDPRASGVIAYVIQGEGTTRCGDEEIAWSPGDIMLFPGSAAQHHETGDSDAVLWVVSNEPQVAFEGLQPPAVGMAPTGVVHYKAADIAAQSDYLVANAEVGELPGYAIVLSSEQNEASRNVLPTLTLAMNTLPGGTSQPPHRHNSVAVSLVVSGEDCYSMIDGKRKDWSPWATTITPPVSVHSHHNGGDSRAMFLIVQDGGLYYHTRAMGFEFAEE